MPIRAFEQHIPLIHPTAFIDETAVIIGEVEIGQDSSIWPYCVIRGDIQRITIGACTSIQDGTIIHVTHDSRFCPGGQPTVIGNDVTVGHKVILHACTIGNQCLIGMGSIIMDGAVVGEGTIVGAGSLVTQGMKLKPGCLYYGSPAQFVRTLNRDEIKGLKNWARRYVKYAEDHLAGRYGRILPVSDDVSVDFERPRFFATSGPFFSDKQKLLDNYFPIWMLDKLMMNSIC